MAVAHPAVAAPRQQARAADRAPGAVAIGVLVGGSLAIVVVLLYALWAFWPTQAVLKSSSAQPVHLFGIHRLVAPEVRLMIVVALAGALGGQMHAARSLAWYVGHRGLRWRWMPYYLAAIVIGAGLASIFYLVLRGGILGGNATTADTNPYGFAALGALVGLFTEQALEMLRRVATDVFASAPQGADTVPSTTGGTPATPAATALAARTGAATNVTASTATLEGDATADGSAASYHFDYGTTTGYGETTAVHVVGASNGTSHVTADVSELTAGTVYHFRLVVADADGRWTTGGDSTFATPTG